MTNFKGYFLLAIAIAVYTLNSSCKKMLDYQSPSALNIDQTFSSVAYTNNEILGIYNKVAGRSAFGGNLGTALAVGGDDVMVPGNGNYDPTANYSIGTYGVNSNAGALFDTFTQMYGGIERANIAIKYIPLSPLYKAAGADKITMQRYLGEALALRALFYYELIINWGDVPATFVPAADAPTQFMKNSDRDSTYDHILNDLKTAENLVEWRSTLPAYVDFRLTKGAIKALRARIALERGGFSLRTATHTMERRSDYQKYYQIALEECNDVITSGQHGLNPVFENIFKSLHTATRYDDAHELMFEIAMWGGFNDSDLARTYGVYYSNSDTWGNGGGGANILPTYFYTFQNGTDQRRDATVCTFMIGKGNLKYVQGMINMNVAKFRKSWTAFTASSTLLTLGVNWPVMRYADVLLMYAEAANELGETKSLSASQALQLVQRRAYGSNPLPVVPNDKQGFFEAIVKERLLEFGGEGIRKYDLIRWNRLASTITDIKAKLPYLAMNAPAAGNPFPPSPDLAFYNPVPFTNKDCTTEESTLDIYLGPNNKAYYTASTVTPSGYTNNAWWRRQLGIWDNGNFPGSSYITDPNTGFACKFQANKSELLPYPQRVLIESRGSVAQNYGYN